MPETDEPQPGRRQLDKAPGERYRGSRPPAPSGPAGAETATAVPLPQSSSAGSARRAVLAAASVAGVAAIGRAMVGQVDVGPGTLVIAAFVGWLVALALVWGVGGRPIPRRALLAALLAGGAILAGVLLEWALALAGGGVLGPLDYIAERYGLLAWAEILVAASVAAVRAR
jgi:hypothetical protein